MKVSYLRTRIMIQVHDVETDEIGNHVNTWRDYYECWADATTPNVTLKEESEAAQTLESSRVDFTIRQCRMVENLTSTEYRVVLKGRIYDIDNVSHLSFRGNSIKLCTHLTRR